MIHLEGRCSQAGTQSCIECNCPSLEYQCEDCLGSDLFCSTCVLLTHVHHPLHHLQRWNGGYFEAVLLKTLGLRIQLGHATGQVCLNPCRVFNNDFVVINTHGIHEVSLDFCDYPQATAMFHVLKQYHLLSFKSKVSAFEFYHTLRWMSNNTGLLPVKLLKRSGRGHDPSGIDETAKGDCAVLCPACPHTRKNLLANWKNGPQQWLYGLFLAINVVLNENIDPSLSYKGFLCSSADIIQEKSTCSSHNAVNMADMKINCRLAATGLGTINCTHHNMKCPNAIYINMDYLFFLTLHHSILNTLNTLNVSYDIVCQWHKHLWHRMSAFPLPMQLSCAVKTVSFFMPKFHLSAHICHILIGRTDGEAPECSWANISPVASSTKEMGPGVWRDMLDNYFRDSNWKKLVGLEKHCKAFEDLDDGLQGEYGTTLKQWREQVEAWEHNTVQPNHFERKAQSIATVAKEDQIDLQTGTSLALHKDCTPSVLISTGLELEEQQVHAMDNQEGNESAASNNLWLLSQLNRTVPCDMHLEAIECKLHCVQAHNALHSLHSNLHAQTAILKYKDQNLCGQEANMRACNTLKAIETRIENAASTYKCTHTSLIILAPQPLDQANIHSMTDILWGEMKGTRKLSWIWHIQGVGPNEMDDDNTFKDMRVEWCKARAWAMCWAEEMWRVVQFLEWGAQCWDNWGKGNALQDADKHERQMVYVKHQGVLHQMLAKSFESSWADTLALVDRFEPMDVDSST
ncbi:hypothetical protein EDD22DRAFT_978598 [Suillus occidentalis]|nr:hypothetical protein EDD22DRAFT_978598 [Suillus occidentalis]